MCNSTYGIIKSLEVTSWYTHNYKVKFSHKTSCYYLTGSEVGFNRSGPEHSSYSSHDTGMCFLYSLQKCIHTVPTLHRIVFLILLNSPKKSVTKQFSKTLNSFFYRQFHLPQFTKNISVSLCFFIDFKIVTFLFKVFLNLFLWNLCLYNTYSYNYTQVLWLFELLASVDRTNLLTFTKTPTQVVKV